MQQVRQASRVSDARVILEHKSYDIVLCDYHFDGSEMSGQDLLDELRREQLLPYSTVFVMVTGEASYAKVAEAAEAAHGRLSDQALHQRLAGPASGPCAPSQARAEGDLRGHRGPRTSRPPPNTACAASRRAASSGSTPPASVPSCCCA